MSKRMPGPWRHEREIENRFDSKTGEPAKPFIFDWIISSTGRAGCAFGEGDEAIANAQLIAAAPELLEALNFIIEIGKRDMSNPKYDSYFEFAREVLSKAKGGA